MVGGDEAGAQAARLRAMAVLRVRSRALAVALLPAAVAVVLLAGGATGRLGGAWDPARWAVTTLAVLVLLAAAGVGLVVVRARPAVSPTVPIREESAPDLYRLVRDLADRLGVPAPSAIALTPDCDSWLEDRTHPAHGPPSVRQGTGPSHLSGRRARSGPVDGEGPVAPVLVIGSPFLWWMRVAELRAVLAPVVAGTGPSAHPDIAAARRFVRGLDAAVAEAAKPGRGLLGTAALGLVGWVARLLLRSCRVHAAEMERGVAVASAERAQDVDYGLRIVAQEQVGLAYAGWDRLLTRVALPAWRMGRWPSRLDAGVVSALTELSRRDRLAEGFASRLGERPACDLLEEPGAVDEAASLLAARLFHGAPAEPGPDWCPVDWQKYPEEVVDRKWRMEAARLHAVLDTMGRPGADHPAHAPGPEDRPTLDRVIRRLEHGAGAGESGVAGTGADGTGVAGTGADGTGAGGAEAVPGTGGTPGTGGPPVAGVHGDAAAPEPRRAGAAPGGPHAPDGMPDAGLPAVNADEVPDATPHRVATTGTAGGSAEAELAARLSAEVAREEAAGPRPPAPGPADQDWESAGLMPVFPPQPPRSGRELLVDHVTAMVCCAAVDTAGAAPGLDWLDGPSLLVAGERIADLAPRVLTLVEDGDATPLRSWLSTVGVRAEKPVRLV
ncbi:hypothetical protein [Streptomyces sp. GC420]|uniref:hypothetical protein n=1 Tax=Streptomyces sp. GC420 TaxID=2697568 RepID=UPI0014150EA7|nr:hypothetical protein [Streptomyces sp. GC420]NBM20361.1 hypothetical protein [Streptomyces sp. GC420]